jgi:hypothetical protein
MTNELDFNASAPAAESTPEQGPAAPETTPTPAASGPARLDLLVVSQNPSFNMVEQGLYALMNFLHTANVGRATDEALAKAWTEIYLAPGATPHEAFVRHGYDVAVPPFLELVVHNALTPERLPWGPDGGVRFWLEFRGSLFSDLDGRFKNRLREVLNTRIDVLTRPHEALPPHRVVLPGEEAVATKRLKKDRASMRVGTAVEEF